MFACGTAYGRQATHHQQHTIRVERFYKGFRLSVTDYPEHLSRAEMGQLRDLGIEVTETIASAGIPVVFHPEPFEQRGRGVGAHVCLDTIVPGSIYLYWECAETLRSSAMAASVSGNFDTPEVRLSVEVAFAMGEALVRILARAGYQTGMGVDMAEDYVWVRRPDERPLAGNSQT